MMDFKMKKSKAETKEGKKRYSPVRVTDARFNSILKKNPAVLIDFWAEWCGLCKAIAPRIEELSEKYAGRVFFGKVDIDKNPKTAKRFGVEGFPTLLLLKKGKEVNRIIGFAPKRTIEKAVNQAFNFKSLKE
jgi:thioredoxin 1